MKNRHGTKYEYVPVSSGLYHFRMDDGEMRNYWRMGYHHVLEEGAYADPPVSLDFVDPPGGPYIAKGDTLANDEVIERLFFVEGQLYIETDAYVED